MNELLSTLETITREELVASTSDITYRIIPGILFSSTGPSFDGFEVTFQKGSNKHTLKITGSALLPDNYKSLVKTVIKELH